MTDVSKHTNLNCINYILIGIGLHISRSIVGVQECTVCNFVGQLVVQQ